MGSSSGDSDVCLEGLLRSKLSEGEGLMRELSEEPLRSVDGVAKLEKKIRQEVKFLQKFLAQEKHRLKLKREHLQCSNLQHLSAVVGALRACDRPQGVLQSFSWGEEQVRKVTVDVVSEGGLVWTKVIARNPKALDLNSCGGNQFGQRSIMDQVRDFLSCARSNTRMFRAPRVVFVFHNGVSEALARRLEAKGLVVRGEVISTSNPHMMLDEDNSSDDSSEDEDLAPYDQEGDNRLESSSPFAATDCQDQQQQHNQQELDPSTLNLDITAMIAYVSALTNGCSDHDFREPILSEQASWERARPAKPELDALFAGKRLVCCESAMRDFRAILGTLGGQGERLRAEELRKRVDVVPDRVSPRLAHLDLSGKIKERSRAIFGTGDCMRVVTVTANSGFVRAARGQGMELAVALHESRALTEDKMMAASAKGIGVEAQQQELAEEAARED